MAFTTTSDIAFTPAVKAIQSQLELEAEIARLRGVTGR